MTIKKLFDPSKNINRSIEKVITYGVSQEARLKSEISEYVVTDSIDQQFENLLLKMEAAMDIGGENEVGVWVSGFYGSGKSSFTKYLGLAFDDRIKIDGVPFIQHLQDRLKRKGTKSLLSNVAKRFPAAVLMLDLASDKTLFLADYFIRNDSMAADDKQEKLNRFLNLIHGDQSVTPTEIESGMFAAYSASLRSACLSRQVGAAITAKSGEVIATGCNDVPKAGGGLYSHASGKGDMRCIHQEGRLCFNDLHKRKLQVAVGAIIDRVLGEEDKGLGKDGESIKLHELKRKKLLDAIYKETRIKDLIEYSRSVHAEMDAIVSLARVGGTGLQDATLYTTTFPCHNCARHIVASGIMKVFYVEPYEKSLAKDLHDDAIAFEIEESKDAKPKRVEFLHFEGVAPRQFHNLFRAIGRKNDEGKFVPIRPQEAHKAVPEYLDGYQDFEVKAVEHLEEELTALRENTVKIPPDEGPQVATMVVQS